MHLSPRVRPTVITLSSLLSRFKYTHSLFQVQEHSSGLHLYSEYIIFPPFCVDILEECALEQNVSVNNFFIIIQLTNLSVCLSVQDSEFSVSKSAPADDSSSRLSGPCPSKSDSAAVKDSANSLASVLATLPAPPGGLKRKHSGDGPSAIFNPPSKQLRPGRRI